MNRFAGAGAAVLLLGTAVFGFACSDDDEGSEEDIEAVRAALTAHLAADAAYDAEAFFATVTDDFVENVFGPFGFTEEQIREDPESYLGTTGVDPAAAVIEVDGDSATATVPQTSEGNASVGWLEGSFVKEDDTWLLDSYEPADAAETPDDANEVEVSLQDFAFEFDADSFEPGKPQVLNIQNDGDQPHHLVMVKLEDDVDLEEALNSEEPPEGITDIGDTFFFQADQAGQLVLTQPLEAGRYAFLCFLTDPPENFEGEPHYLKGMQADFRVE
jgi:hypothetical protein